MAERRARLERHAGDAADVEFLRHDMRRAAQRPDRSPRRSPNRVSTSMLSGTSSQTAGAPGRIASSRMQHERQFLVTHLDRLGGVHRLRLGLGDHHGDRFADMARLVGGQQQMRADEHRAAAGRGELHVVFGLRQRIVRNGLEPIGRAIGAGEDAEHARHRFCPRRIDRDDARMRIRRAHHRRIGLAVESEIVGEAAIAGDEPRIFLARHRLADEAEARLSGLVLSSIGARRGMADATPPRLFLNPPPERGRQGWGKHYDAMEDEFALMAAVAKARARSGLIEAELAKRMKTTQSTIARLEAAAASPRPARSTASPRPRGTG